MEETVNATSEAFGDAAIVVVGAGESNDYIKDNVAEGLGFEEPLQLSKNDRDIIDLATEKFDKVIVLLNNNSAIEVGDLKNNEKIDSILWIGHPGNYGLHAPRGDADHQSRLRRNQPRKIQAGHRPGNTRVGQRRRSRGNHIR